MIEMRGIGKTYRVRRREAGLEIGRASCRERVSLR